MSTRRHSTRDARSDAGPVKTITNDIANRIGSHKYDMWFGSAKMDVRGGELRVAANSAFAASWIGSHFTRELQSAARRALGAGASVTVLVDPERSDRDEAERSPGGGPAPAGSHGPSGPHGPPGSHEPAAHNGAAGNGRPKHGPGPRRERLRRLEDFVVGTSNQLAIRAAEQVAADPDAKLISPLIVHGECGVGKTHLLQGVCQRFAEVSGAPGRMRYVTGEQFTNEYIAAVRNNTIDAFRSRIRRLELLAIDDVHFLSNKARTQHEFQCTMDAIQHLGARLVLASDEHPRNIRKFSTGLVSRLLSGMVVEIKPPDREMRVRLIERLGAARGLRFAGPAAEALASRCAGSVRELEGAITTLAAMDTLRRAGDRDREAADGGEVGLMLVEQLFGEQARKSGAPVRIGGVIEGVCERLGVSRGDLMGAGRHKRIVLARAVVAHLARDMTTLSFPEIADALGRKHHSTIHAAAARLRRQMADGEAVEAGEGGRQRVSLRDLTEQLRHEIGRKAARG